MEARSLNTCMLPHRFLTAADAGADYASYLDEDTEYDLVQTAANNGQFEAVVKLVEAGASWRLQRGQQRLMGGFVYYVPEMLSLNKQGLKVRAQNSVLVATQKLGLETRCVIMSWTWTRNNLTYQFVACLCCLPCLWDYCCSLCWQWLWVHFDCCFLPSVCCAVIGCRSALSKAG
jgi:hypothetical protein